MDMEYAVEDAMRQLRPLLAEDRREEGLDVLRTLLRAASSNDTEHRRLQSELASAERELDDFRERGVLVDEHQCLRRLVQGLETFGIGRPLPFDRPEAVALARDLRPLLPT